MQKSKKVIIFFMLLITLVFVSCSRDTTKTDEDVPIEIGYERVEITNLQSTENGTYIYILKDTATNREYLYVLREHDIGKYSYGCSSSIIEIGEWIEPKDVNDAQAELEYRNNLSHTGELAAYEYDQRTN